MCARIYIIIYITYIYMMQYSNGPNGSCLFAKGTLQIDLLTEAAPVNLVGLASSSGRLSTAPSHAFACAIV